MIYETKQRHTGVWVFTIILVAVLGAAGWYGYRWYDTGEVLPIPLPLASAETGIEEIPVAPEKVQQHTVPTFHPRYISIADIGIGQTRVFPVGVDQNNQLKSPANIYDAAWYDKSSTPGSGGVILIDGHNGGTTKDGVFAKLINLAIGADIIVDRGDGKSFTYKVVENKSVPIEEVNATGMKIMGESADPTKEGLNLITCDGVYVPRLGMFDRRIMLRAVLVS